MKDRSNAYANKIAVVTGAGSGIGRALARGLAERGAHVAISDINDAELGETVRLCASANLRGYRVDVSKRDDVYRHAEDVKCDFGNAHYLFNNAGVGLAATFEHATIEEMEWLLSINLWGVIYVAKAFLPSMLAQREGCIVNISSTAGLLGAPGLSAYCISKFGVRGLTETLWRELDGTGVSAVSVHPGGIATNIEARARRSVNAGDYERQVSKALADILVTSPEDCARDILDGVARGKKRILPGKYATTMSLVSRLSPGLYGPLFRMMGVDPRR